MNNILAQKYSNSGKAELFSTNVQLFICGRLLIGRAVGLGSDHRHI